MQNHHVTIEAVKARVDRAVQEVAAQDGNPAAQANLQANLCLDLEYMIMALRVGMREVGSEGTRA